MIFFDFRLIDKSWITYLDESTINTTKISKTKIVDEVDESEYSNLVKGPMHLKLKEPFKNT